MAKVVEGQWFGNWLVLEAKGQGWFRCRCSCGFERDVLGGNLAAKGKSRNCTGHLARRPHPQSARYHPLYATWQQMMARCYNKGRHDYPRYGGSGVTVCERWHDFWNFISDMSPKPEGTQLDRREPRGNPKGRVNTNPYSLKNCYWATPQQNSRHRRNTRYITANGQTKSAAEWAEITGMTIRTLLARIDEYGWSEQDAVTKPKHPWKPRFR